MSVTHLGFAAASLEFGIIFTCVREETQCHEKCALFLGWRHWIMCEAIKCSQIE